MTAGERARESRRGSGGPAGGAADDSFRIVLNYRREDTSGHAGRLYDALATRFGDDHVFMDIDKIDPGEDFARAIERAIDASDVFLALIGREWLTVTDARGRRRLATLDDFVRMEIETALARDVRVIPVLVQGAEMPSSDELPDSVAALARRNAVELRDTSWRSDVERLADALAKIREDTRARGPAASPDDEEPLGRKPGDEHAGRSRVPVVVAGAVLLAAAALLGLFLLLRDGETARSSERGSDAGAPAIAPGKIAYHQRDAGVFIMASDGSDVTPLPGTSGDRDPDWSDDGTKLAVSRDDNIWIVPLDRPDEATPVTDDENSNDGQPAWSPGDEALAFERKEPGARDGIWVVDLAGDGAAAEPRSLTVVSRQAGVAPDWSPDGELIAFQAAGDVWMMRNDGTEAESLTDAIDGFQYFPTWAPSGRQIAFVETGAGADSCKISVLDLEDGRRVRPVTEGKLEGCRDLAWSPDGDQITFAGAAGATGIWVVDADGTGEPTRVLDDQGLSRPAWGP